MRKACLLFLLLLRLSSIAQTFIKLDSGTNTNIRGLCVVNDLVAWASGSNGYVAHTIDGGKTWQWQQLAAFKTFDFRDIEAFSANDALLLSAGSPAVILKTTDGGKTWQEKYRNSSPDIFLDGMDFAGMKGIAFGDPIAHKLQLLKTLDAGNTWQDISANLLQPVAEGEAGFAASGTSIKVIKKRVWIGTGGTFANMYSSTDFGKTWIISPTGINHGAASTGIFSVDFINHRNGAAVGGDYKKDTLRTRNMMLTSNSGKTWHSPETATHGYRSSICYITNRIVLATGTSGTDISYNSGKTWKKLTSDGFNCIQKSNSGKTILCAGPVGKIYKISLVR